MKWFRKSGAPQSPSPLLIGHSALRGGNYEEQQPDDWQPNNTVNLQLEMSGRAASGDLSGGRASANYERLLPHVPTNNDEVLPAHFMPRNDGDANCERVSSGIFGRIGYPEVSAVKSQGELEVRCFMYGF